MHIREVYSFNHRCLRNCSKDPQLPPVSISSFSFSNETSILFKAAIHSTKGIYSPPLLYLACSSDSVLAPEKQKQLEWHLWKGCLKEVTQVGGKFIYSFLLFSPFFFWKENMTSGFPAAILSHPGGWKACTRMGSKAGRSSSL